ncbi:hypothetical protein ACFQ36_02885 [Arthrobacter sp. GCM10027362]|uniref:hypothetical protein n=1 Tax=Arthrobacter sp. GCM10027362 TaxID=3273379 RepID=UPI0036455B15
MILDLVTVYTVKNLCVQTVVHDAAAAASPGGALDAARRRLASELGEAAHTYGVDIPPGEVCFSQNLRGRLYEVHAFWSPPDGPVELFAGPRDGEILEVSARTDMLEMEFTTLAWPDPQGGAPVPVPVPSAWYEYGGFNDVTRHRVFMWRQR